MYVSAYLLVQNCKSPPIFFKEPTCDNEREKAKGGDGEGRDGGIAIRVYFSEDLSLVIMKERKPREEMEKGEMGE